MDEVANIRQKKFNDLYQKRSKSTQPRRSHKIESNTYISPSRSKKLKDLKGQETPAQQYTVDVVMTPCRWSKSGWRYVRPQTGMKRLHPNQKNAYHPRSSDTRIATMESSTSNRRAFVDKMDAMRGLSPKPKNKTILKYLSRQRAGTPKLNLTLGGALGTPSVAQRTKTLLSRGTPFALANDAFNRNTAFTAQWFRI